MRSSVKVGLEPFEGITNEWQAHLRCLRACLASISNIGSLQMCSIICLVDFISWEVGGVNVRLQLRFKWRADTAKLIKLNATEELVVLDLIGTPTTKAVLRIADQAKQASLVLCLWGGGVMFKR